MHPLISYLIKHKSKTLAGNKEYYEILEIIEGKFILHGGDTYINKEEYRYEIPEAEALSKLKNYYWDKCNTFRLEHPDSETEWENFLAENWYI